MRGIFNIATQFELFGINHRSAKSQERETAAPASVLIKREREGGGEWSRSFYLTFTEAREEQQDGPLIPEKILFSAYLESHFWEDEVKPVGVRSHNPVLYRRNEQCLSVSSSDFVLEHSYPLKIKGPSPSRLLSFRRPFSLNHFRNEALDLIPHFRARPSSVSL